MLTTVSRQFLLATTSLASALIASPALVAARYAEPENSGETVALSHYNGPAQPRAQATPTSQAQKAQKAWTSSQASSTQTRQSVSLDTLPGDVDFSADQLTYDAETQEVRALGQVVLVRSGYKLIAGEIRYSEKTGIAEAVGAVELITPDGERIFTPRLTLSNELKTAFVEDFRLLLTDGSQAAAESGSHDDATGKTTLNRAVYSPCKICEGDPNSRPIWQIKAVRVTHDREKKRIYYKDAYLELLGVPIFWAPSFSHPDPTVDKASGFLPIRIKRRNELGLIVSAPYHYVIDDTQDLTLTPTITTLEGPVLGAQYRHNTGGGFYELEGSLTYADTLNFTPTADQTIAASSGDNGLRGHIFARGSFNHDDTWRSSFDVGWTSDDTYLRRYDFTDVDTITSEYQLEGFFGKSYVSARTLAFQGLRIEDEQGLTGFALPLINAEYVSDYKPLGGTFKVKGNALALQRFDGLDTQRLSATASWDKRIITPKGFVVDNHLSLRADAYNISELDTPDDPAFAGTRDSFGRVLAQASSRVSWPLIKPTANGHHTIEPILEVTVSPASGSPGDLVNEDSRAFELSDLNLFSPDRTSGLDLYEEGSRVTYGLGWRYDSARFSTDVFFGQSTRLSGDRSSFPNGTGLEGNTSDFVGHTRVALDNVFSLEHRYRLDDAHFTLRRNEINLTFGPGEKWGAVARYFFLDRDLGEGQNDIFINREDREELQLSAFYQIDDNWRISGLTVQNLTSGRDTIEYGGEISYIDECIEIGLQVRENFTVDRDFNPGTQVIFRLKLTNLG